MSQEQEAVGAADTAPEILVVEDEWIVARDIQQSLEKMGYRVPFLARSAETALGQLEKSVPDLVLMDVRLDGPVDGVSLAGEIRTRWKVPVVFVTALFDQPTMARANKLDPYGYVTKPFGDAQLRAAVNLALERSRRERQHALGDRQMQARTVELQSKAEALERRLQKISEVLAESGIVAPQARHLGRDLEEALLTLSRREVQVLRLLVKGWRVSSMARELTLSTHTVRNHLKAILQKTGVHSQAELIERIGPVPPELNPPARRRKAV